MNAYLLTFVKDGKATAIIQRDLVQDLQREKSKLKTDPKYRGGKFEIRTVKGFENVKILRK